MRTPQNNAIHQTRHHDDLGSPLPLCGLVMASVHSCSTTSIAITRLPQATKISRHRSL
jgi:hypothetical protein